MGVDGGEIGVTVVISGGDVVNLGSSGVSAEMALPVMGVQDMRHDAGTPVMWQAGTAGAVYPGHALTSGYEGCVMACCVVCVLVRVGVAGGVVIMSTRKLDNRMVSSTRGV